MRKVLFIALSVTVTTATLPFLAQAGPRGRRQCFADSNGKRRGVMRGDVDGNGTGDEIFLDAKRKQGSCRYFLVADMGKSQDSKRLRGNRYTMRHYSRPEAVVRIDTYPGKEISVLLNLGASAGTVGVFTVRDKAIRRMAINGQGAPPHNQFVFGGSITSWAVDCAHNRPEGTVVMTRADSKNGTCCSGPLLVERRWFEVQGRSFQRTSEAVERREIRRSKLQDRYPEFRQGAVPFHLCQGRARF